MYVKATAWIGLAATGCTLPELVTPVAGSCSAAIDGNRWPKFDGSGGALPVIGEAETGWEQGLVPPDFELIDQHGDATCLWQMVGHYVVLDVSALWCGPCKDIAKTVACTQGTIGDDLVYMTFIREGIQNEQPATQADAMSWSDEFGLGGDTQTPVIADGGQVFTSGFPGSNLPVLALLDQDLRMLTWGQGIDAEARIKGRLERLTGKSTAACTP